MAVGRDEGGRGTVVNPARILLRPGDPHRILRPWITLAKWESPRGFPVGLPVAEPVMDLELDPGCGKHVQSGRRMEPMPGEEFATHLAGVRCQKLRLLLRKGGLERDVSTEPAADAPHCR